MISWTEAEKDCTAALDFDPKSLKALWRRGISRRELGKFKEAQKDLEAALVLEPTNKTVRAELEKVLSAVKPSTKSTVPKTESVPNNTGNPQSTLKELESPLERLQVSPKPQEIKRPARRRILIEEFGDSRPAPTEPKAESKEPAKKNEPPQPHTIIKDEKTTQELKPADWTNLKPPSSMIEFVRDFKSVKSDSCCLFQYFKVFYFN